MRRTLIDVILLVIAPAHPLVFMAIGPVIWAYRHSHRGRELVGKHMVPLCIKTELDLEAGTHAFLLGLSGGIKALRKVLTHGLSLPVAQPAKERARNTAMIGCIGWAAPREPNLDVSEKS